MSVFYLKRGDTQPIMDVSLNDPDGTDYDASGATVSLHVKLPTGTLVRAMTVVDGPTGLIRYTWVADDWNYLVPGLHRMEYQVTPSGGGTITFPNNGYDFLSVTADLDSLSAPVALDAGAILLESGSVNTKISALTDGSPAQATDEIVIARAGTNRKLALDDLFAGLHPLYLEMPLTAGQVMTLGTVPIEVLPAVAGIVYQIYLAHFNKTTTDVFAGTGNNLQLFYDASTDIAMCTFADAFLATATVSGRMTGQFASSVVLIGEAAAEAGGKAIIFKRQNGIDFSGVGSPCTLKLWYYKLPSAV